MKTLVIFMFMLIAGLTVDPIEPPLWPEHFSQSFQLTTSSGTTVGKGWFDFTTNNFRLDYQNGTGSSCDWIFKSQAKCISILKQSLVYFIVADQYSCCHDSNQGQTITRDWLRTQNYTFVGQEEIDGQSYYKWQHYNWTHVNYYSDKSQRRIPRRDERDKAHFDYWTNSFDDGPIDQSVFDVPDYCQRSCSQVREELQKNEIYEKYQKQKQKQIQSHQE